MAWYSVTFLPKKFGRHSCWVESRSVDASSSEEARTILKQNLKKEGWNLKNIKIPRKQIFKFDNQ